MCDDDFDDCFDDGDNNNEDFEGEGCEDNEFEGVDDDFGPPPTGAGPNHDDCAGSLDLEDFMKGVGFGYEMWLGERKRPRKDDDII